MLTVKETAVNNIDIPKGLTRRGFISGLAPACVLTCFGSQGLMRMVDSEAPPRAQHKFEREIKLTTRQLWADRGRNSIVLINTFADAIGKEKTIELLKQHAYNRAKRNGERYRQRKGTNDFETFKTRFIGPGSYSDSLIEASVVENSDTAIEIKVTECVISEIWRKMNAGDFGHAYQCWGDHCWQDGYNTKIKLIRDKTLMQGHDYCNHRYVLTD
jgi:hypothetical protein